jgi:ribosomal-protein-alanine N-acetyltransferase
MASEIIIRRMTMADVDGVAAVEAATFPTPWSRDAFASEMKNVAARYLVAEKDGKVIGYAGAWLILDESHITNIAIAEEERGNGYGRRLAAALAAHAKQQGLRPLLCCKPRLEKL